MAAISYSEIIGLIGEAKGAEGWHLGMEIKAAKYKLFPESEPLKSLPFMKNPGV